MSIEDELAVARKWAKRWRAAANRYADIAYPDRAFRRESNSLSRRIARAQRNKDGSLDGLPTGLHHALMRAGYGTLKSVERLSDEEILAIRNIGRRGLARIRAKAAKANGQDVPPNSIERGAGAAYSYLAAPQLLSI
jgi:hypothetical protein